VDALQEALIVLLVAALPIGELRAAIPLALIQYDMHPLSVYFLGVVGNMLPVPFLLLFLGKVSNLLRRISLFDRFLTRLFAYTQRRHSALFNKFGAFALVMFVAIPLPATGAWSGSLAAFLFGVPFKYALPLIALGVMIAGVLVTLSTSGIWSFFK